MERSDEQIQTESMDISVYPLPGGPFATSHVVIRVLYQASSLCFIPWVSALDNFLSMFIKTTGNDSRPRNLFTFCIQAIFLFICLLCSFPLVMIALVVWCPLQLIRPRAYTYVCPEEINLDGVEKYKRIDANDGHSDIASVRSGAASQFNKFSIITANICLMPEFISHINNLHSSSERGKLMAKHFCGEIVPSAKRPPQSHSPSGNKQTETEFLFSPWSSETLSGTGQGLDGLFDSISNFCFEDKDYDDSTADVQSITSTLWSVTSKERTVCNAFPTSIDFLCLQEVFHRTGTRHLIRGLRQKYPYIIHDVTLPIHDRFLSPMGSGLCIASKHPFIDISFKAFPHGNRDDKLACKGLLMTKVYLGPGENGEERVGYIATTHLQAWSHSDASSVRCKQLQCIMDWTDEFYKTSRTKSCNDVVVFNVITGDFNFDAISYFDVREQKCDFLKHFIDPCMDRESNKQHTWVVGTELQQKMMHNDSVRTPQGLQRMMVSELERPQFVASTMPIKSSLQRVGDGKRRIDYILYKDCEHCELTVKDYKFFTCLATLSDHIPVGMMFGCEKRTT